MQFCLREGNELRKLRYSDNPQITFVTGENGKEYLKYEEDVSKCHSNGLKNIGLEGKKVFAYHNDDHDRCLLCIYKYSIIIFLIKKQCFVPDTL